MYKTEEKIVEQLILLKNTNCLAGIKAEFEAEGSSIEDLHRLRRITSHVGIDLFLKIGGPEAKRDIINSLEVGVDGIIAPMIESKFAAKKFIDAYQSIYMDKDIHTSINIETKQGVRDFKEIAKFISGSINNITFGRSDLSSSYFSDLAPESKEVYLKMEEVSEIAIQNNMTFTFGGGVTKKTLSNILDYHILQKNTLKIETRKVVFNFKEVAKKPELINEALKFEELYILSKKEFIGLLINSEIGRLTELEKRIKNE